MRLWMRSFKNTRFTMLAAIVSVCFAVSACSDAANATTSAELSPQSAKKFVHDSPYSRVLERMGGPAVFGQPLTEVILLDDGTMEQVYETVIVTSPAASSGNISFRPLPKMLGMPSAPPGKKLYDRRHNMIFYPVNDELGYHVPIFFDEFISWHGGTEQSGPPISEVMLLDINGEKIARQCFTSYCLDYFPTAPEGQRVHLAPLGVMYLSRRDTAVVESSPANNSEALSILVGEEKSQLRSNESQILYVLIIKSHNKKPVAQVMTTLEVKLPNGSQYSYAIDPTGIDGWTRYVLPPLSDCEHGMMVVYSVCLHNPVKTGDCASGSYLIWDK